MESKGLMFKRLKNSSDFQTGQLTLGQIASRKLENIVDSGASLHLMSTNELTSGEQDTIRRSKEPTVMTTVNGKAFHGAQEGTSALLVQSGLSEKRWREATR